MTQQLTLRRRPRWAAGAALLAAGTLAVAISGCSPSGSPSGSGGSTIKVGQITTQSGGYPFADTVPGTQSYINMLNANGGINGHKVQLVSGDDKGDASEAAQLARKMVQQDGVVGMVGNTSLVDCQANRAIYESKSIAVIGGGTHTDCFSQPNWTPVNAGPAVGHVVEWTYLVDEIKPKVICGIDQNDPVARVYSEQLRAEFEAKNNVTFGPVTYTNDSSQNPTPAVTSAKSAGCDAIYMSAVAPNYAAFVQAAKTIGLDATFINTGAGYDDSLPGTVGSLGDVGALGPQGKGVFVAAELAPTSSDNENVQIMVKQFKKDGTPANFWSEIGWLSAKVFFEGLAQNKDNDVTTAAGVLKGLQAMKPIDTGFAATPLTFGTGKTHAPNLGSQILQVVDGKFTVAPGQSGGWTVIPPLTPLKAG